MDIDELLQRSAVIKASLPQNLAGSWYRIENLITSESADIRLYGEIGVMGATAMQFMDEIAQLNVRTLNVRVNSPGGDVFDGIAIYNALKNHPAQVNIHIDALAASIASVIAMAGDNVTIADNAQMMIHDAHAVAAGPADVMREAADLLDASSDIIASIYQRKAGGQARTWRAAMKATTWYVGAQAVEAKLADKTVRAGVKNLVEEPEIPEAPEPQEDLEHDQELVLTGPAIQNKIDFVHLFREAFDAE